MGWIKSSGLSLLSSLMLEGTALSQPRSITHVVVTGTGGHKRHLLLLCEHPEPFLKEKKACGNVSTASVLCGMSGTHQSCPQGLAQA